MKEINSSYITTSALQPFKQGTWEHLQSAYQEALAALAQNMINGANPSTAFAIVYGCQLSSSGGNYTVTQGAIWYNGKIYLVDAVGTTADPSGGDTRICKISTTFLSAANADPVTMTDGSTRNVHEIKKIVIENGTAATGGYIGEYDDLIRLCGANPTSSTVASSGSNYDVTFEYSRTIDFTAVTSGGVTFDFDFTNAAVGSMQRFYMSLANTDAITLAGASDITFQVCEGATLTAYNNSSPIIKTASGTEIAAVEMVYLGYNGSVHFVSVKLWS